MEAIKHSKGDSVDYIAQFQVMNPRQPATKARVLLCNFENLHKSKSETHPKRGQIIYTRYF